MSNPIKRIKTLRVKKTSNSELSEKWNMFVNINSELYVRCNCKGQVNWDKTVVYRASELIEKNNVIIVK